MAIESFTEFAQGSQSGTVQRFRLPEGVLFFLHIAKTAGSAFSQSLKNQYSLDEVCPVQFWPEFLALSQATRSQFRLISAHLSYDAWKYLDRKPTTITILRDPVDRVLSLYDYQQHYFAEFGTDHANESVAEFQRRSLAATQEGITAFLETSDEQLRLAISNEQTRLVGGSMDPSGTSPDSDAAMLERAKAHLREFPFVGLSERMSESLHLFSYEFGLLPQQNVRVNATPDRVAKQDMADGVVSRISEMNVLDLALYEAAVTLFDERYARMLSDLARRYGQADAKAKSETLEVSPERLHTWLHAHYEEAYAARAPEPKNTFRHTMAFGPVGGGWQPWEGTLEKGHRWTGPGKDSTLDLALTTDRPLKLTLRVGFIASWKILQSLRITVNGHQLTIRRLSLGYKWHRITATIPERFLRSAKPFTRIELHVCETVPAQAVRSYTRDPRVLGIAVNSIDIRPKGFF